MKLSELWFEDADNQNQNIMSIAKRGGGYAALLRVGLFEKTDSATVDADDSFNSEYFPMQSFHLFSNNPTRSRAAYPPPRLAIDMIF